jgi:hypothetical protein
LQEQQNNTWYPRTHKLAESKPDLKSLMPGSEESVRRDLDGVVTEDQIGIGPLHMQMEVQNTCPTLSFS